MQCGMQTAELRVLTGAGWGGCAVGLASSESTPLILERIKNRGISSIFLASILYLRSWTRSASSAAGATIRKLS